MASCGDCGRTVTSSHESASPSSATSTLLGNSPSPVSDRSSSSKSTASASASAGAASTSTAGASTPPRAPPPHAAIPRRPFANLSRGAVDSVSTTVSDNVLTPLSSTGSGPFGFGSFVESPTVESMSTRYLTSPATTEPPVWPGRVLPPKQSPLSDPHRNAGHMAETDSGMRSSASPRQRPSPLPLHASGPEPIDLSEPPPHTARSTSSMHSTISNELLDLSNLRRSIQQNLRERPLATDDADLDLESINESESVPSSPYDDGRTISVANALAVFRSSPQYLVVDTRVLEDYSICHLQRSVNVSIPTLLLNRLRKQTTRSGVAGWVSLTRYVSTAAGQALWDGVDLSRPLDLIIIGINGDDLDAPYTLAEILDPLVNTGMVRVLDGGWTAIADEARAAGLVVQDVPINPDSVVVTNASPDMLTPLATSTNTALLVSPATSAPAPSQTNVPAISPLATVNQGHRNLPSLSINTPSSTTPRRPPKLQLNTAEKPVPLLTEPATAPHRTKPKLGGLTIDVGPSRAPVGPQSALPYSTTNQSTPRGGGLAVNPVTQGAKTSTLAPPPGEPWNGSGGLTPIAPSATFANIPPPTPSVPTHSSGSLVKPPQPAIEISTILPNFLYLGPEISTQADVDELLSLGVRRILNVAIECDDDEGLHLREVFEKYYRIPMKDSVDESGVSKGIRDACKILDDARLHSAPVYVHCKAGRSRSVTVVLAYLIHANAWTLHTSYQYVAERRPGISPNIGFVAELMEFETAELGHKHPGRGREETESSNGEEDEEPPLVHREPRLGPRYTRESLPPEFGSERLVHNDDEDDSPVEDAGGEHAPESRHRRKPQPDIEVRKNGQWVLRRTPVDRVTLQPGRRVSKAGLESMIMRPIHRQDDK